MQSNLLAIWYLFLSSLIFLIEMKRSFYQTFNHNLLLRSYFHASTYAKYIKLKEIVPFSLFNSECKLKLQYFVYVSAFEWIQEFILLSFFRQTMLLSNNIVAFKTMGSFAPIGAFVRGLRESDKCKWLKTIVTLDAFDTYWLFRFSAMIYLFNGLSACGWACKPRRSEILHFTIGRKVKLL